MTTYVTRSLEVRVSVPGIGTVRFTEDEARTLVEHIQNEGHMPPFSIYDGLGREWLFRRTLDVVLVQVRSVRSGTTANLPAEQLFKELQAALR